MESDADRRTVTEPPRAKTAAHFIPLTRSPHPINMPVGVWVESVCCEREREPALEGVKRTAGKREQIENR